MRQTVPRRPVPGLVAASLVQDVVDVVQDGTKILLAVFSHRLHQIPQVLHGVPELVEGVYFPHFTIRSGAASRGWMVTVLPALRARRTVNQVPERISSTAVLGKARMPLVANSTMR